ncbi:hypothetical protein QZH41_017453, partial [Actinostola sp. cb2023]
YLNQYHYISPSRSGNHDVRTAIENFQRFAGLLVTGEIDRATVRQMKKPRCGMPDVDDDGLRVRRYKLGSKWSKMHLTYFVEYGQDLPHSVQDRIFAKALKYWADVSGLSFSRTLIVSSADLKISFGSKSHGGSSERPCAYAFDGPGKVLAHAFFPSNGRAHFDEDERFTDDDDDDAMALQVVCFQQNYLNQYHYISPSRSGNHDARTAIENFQRFAGLPVTGEIDRATVRQMKKPRCGLPDVDDDGLRVRSTGLMWSGLSFSRASSASSADLKISFGSRSHGGSSERRCAYAFDGPGKVLAHAFFPSNGRAHFDEDERFTD